MQIFADLQLHSRFSRAVSPQMTLPNIAAWATRKGIGLVATGDWTHPQWHREIIANLEEMGNGLLRVKKSIKSIKSIKSNVESPYFMLATEVSCIYSQGGRGRRVHTLIWVPTIASAEKINKEMTKRGCNLLSDGRPIIGLTSIQVAELVLTIEPQALIIPAHAWTPWFSVYGKMGGFDSIEEAFGPFAKHIYAVETGLSSDPAMNWRIAELDHRAILSFSDAHSGPKLGREATVFEIPDGELSYDAIYQAVRGSGSYRFTRSSLEARIPNLDARIAYTIEFHPEEGKYHYTGHRACKIRWAPEEVQHKGTTCPTCGKPLTQGVMQRVEQLASRSEASLQLTTHNVQLTTSGAPITVTSSAAFPNRPPYVMTVPLQEIISEAIGSPVASPKVALQYDRLVSEFNNEFSILLQSSIASISKIAGERVAEGVDKVRRGDIVIDPGYDGVFGVVKIWGEGETKDTSKEQLSMFS